MSPTENRSDYTSDADPDPQELWALIVAASRQVGGDLAPSLRVHLWTEARRGDRARHRPGVRSYLAAARRILDSPHRPYPRAEAGRILICFSFGVPACTENLLPVAREALRRGRLGGIVAVHDALPALGEFQGRVPVVPAQQLLSAGVQGRRLALWREASALPRALATSLEPDAPSLAALVRRHTGHWFQDALYSALYREGARKIHSLWRPSSVVGTGDFFPLDGQMMGAAAWAGIPTAVVQHGLVGPHWWPFTAREVLLWGEPFRKSLAALGAPPHRLRVCGMPATDSVFARACVQREKQPADGQANVLFLSNSHAQMIDPATFSRVALLLDRLVHSLPSVRWRVRLHPSEDLSFFQNLPGGTRARLEILPRAMALAEALAGCDVAMVVHSAAGLEAMASGRPLLVLNVSAAVDEVIWWPKMGGGLSAQTAEEAKAILQELLGRGQFYRATLLGQEAFLQQVFANRGRAAEAVVDELEAMGREA